MSILTFGTLIFLNVFYYFIIETNYSNTVLLLLTKVNTVFFLQSCQILKLIPSCFRSEEIQTEQKPPTPKIDFCSTTQRDFCVKGFVPFTPGTTQAIVCIYV